MIDRDEFLTGNGTPPWKEVRGWTPLLEKQILIDVANGSSLQTAARRLGTSLLSVMRMRIVNKSFGDAMNEALQIRRALLEEKAWELAVEGVEVETVKGSGDAQTLTTRIEYPNAALLQFLLKADNPTKYGIERTEVRAGPLETPPETIKTDADRVKLRDRLRERLANREQSKVIDTTATVSTLELADLL